MAPRNLSIVVFNASSVGVSWERPPEWAVNGILRQYIITYCEISETNCTMANASGDTTRMVLTQLKENATYNVSVAAFTITTGPFTFALTITGLSICCTADKMIVIG